MAIILTKKSDTASSVPLVADLTNAAGGAELAVNTADKRLFTKTSGGTVVELGINPSSLTLPNGTANGIPYLNGSKVLTSGTALTFDGTNFATTGSVTSGGDLKAISSGSGNIGLNIARTGGTAADWYNYVPSGTSDLVWYKAGDVMRLSGGNLGLGVTPSAWAAFKAIQLQGGSIYSGATNDMRMNSNAYWNGSNFIYTTTNPATQYYQNAGLHAWFTAPSGTAGNAITFTQAMTLDAGGNLLVGTTVTNDTSYGIRAIMGASPAITCTGAATTNASDSYHLYSTGAGAYRFYVDYAGVVHATSTSISAISDIRFKENVRDLDAGLAEIMALKPRLYDWKEGKGANIKNARGFIAQEYELVFPDLIDEWKDAAPEGEDPYKSVRQDLIPVLVKAIQEQQAIIEQLKADVAALKAAP